MSKTPKPPTKLSTDAKRLWVSILRDYPIEDSAFLRVLEVALLALDRAESCRKRIEKDGLMQKDRFGIDKPHPLLPSERDARSAFIHGIKTLNLDPGVLQ